MSSDGTKQTFQRNSMIEHPLITPVEKEDRVCASVAEAEFEAAMLASPEEYNGWEIRRVSGDVCFLDRIKGSDAVHNCTKCNRIHTGDNTKTIRKLADNSFAPGCSRPTAAN